MKKLILITLLFITTVINTHGQNVIISGTSFTIKHKELTFYLDSDTNSYISVHRINTTQVKDLVGKRKDKWHKEYPYGPYNRKHYINTGYDLGHLTPSKITMYDDSTNYHTFSMFNQAPQLSEFNQVIWRNLEDKVLKTIIKSNLNAVIITGVLYDNKEKHYLNKSRIKIPINFYKILVLSNGTTLAWIGSNVNGLVSKTDINQIIKVAKLNNNNLLIQIK